MTKAYTPTIGLEIHVELQTRTKMFCNSRNDSVETRPNYNLCPICLGHPGTLPTINREAVKQVLKIGLAVGGKIADIAVFERKNYFYPDIPKGYQISQYAQPLICGGKLAGVSIKRIHLEEDTARISHTDGEGSLIDFNRAGVPLMELVTEPVIRGAAAAVSFGKALQLLLRYLNVSDADMEKGQMRVEANISMGGEKEMGTKVEIKNLNSFHSVERAIEFEIDRQLTLLKKNEAVLQETRGWDEEKERTFSQRFKEESHDYRYLPDPDLPELHPGEISEFSPDALRRELPELPWEKRERYVKNFKLKESDIDVLVNNMSLAQFFEKVLTTPLRADPQLAANYVTSDLVGLLKQTAGATIPTPAHFAELIDLISKEKISSRGAKDILSELIVHDQSPKKIAGDRRLYQESDEETLARVAAEVINANPEVAAEYRAGKTASLQFLIGQGMKLSEGRANPKSLKNALEKCLTRSV